MSEEKNNKVNRRSMARLAAVQALYQMQQMDLDAQQVISDFKTHHFNEDLEGINLQYADHKLFEALVIGVACRLEDIDPIVVQTLNKDWRFERLESVLKSILRLGCFELIHDKEPPTAVVINEYVEIAKAFYNNQEVAFVNGSLDAIAKIVR